MGLIRDFKVEDNGIFASGKFDSSSIFQGEMPVEIFHANGASGEDAEKCIAHYNSLLEKPEMLEAIQSGLEKFFLFMYDEWQVMDFYEDIFKSLEPVMDTYKTGEKLVTFLHDPRMYVWPMPENETGYGIECDCPWEPEYQCMILIRNDKVLYVGPSDGDTPWQDEDSYYYAWDDEK